MLRNFACAAFATLVLVTQAQTSATIRIWKVGSPHTGDIPHTRMPAELAREAAVRGWRLIIDAFPAEGFATRFFDAIADGSAPDLLVFDNFGIIEGITTGLGNFVGIGRDPVMRARLIQVTTSFDGLLAPARGWTFLITSSANHAAARELALRTPTCAGRPKGWTLPGDLLHVVPEIATAYLTGDTATMLSHVDAERLSAVRPNREPVAVGGVAVCGGWGNGRLAFVAVNASFQADTTIGDAPLLFAFRKTSSSWQLLVAARDPVSNRDFVRLLPWLAKVIAGEVGASASAVPEAATLRSPPDGRFPIAAAGERFGDFGWQSSAAEDVVAEVVEFSYGDDARLFLMPRLNPGAPRYLSAGQLWTTRDDWAWRVWSITRSGEIAFSEVRTFVH